MHILRRFCAAGLALVLSAGMLTAPAAAENTGDLNGDGTVDIFDTVLAKRASLRENAPLSLSITPVTGLAGELVTAEVSVTDNPGIRAMSFMVRYSDGLEPEALPGEESPLMPSAEQFQSLHPTAALIPAGHAVSYFTQRRGECTDDGILFHISFRIPSDAVPGSTYSLSLSDVNITASDGSPAPILTSRGKITVGTPVFTQPEETTIVTTETTAQTTALPQTTETTLSQTAASSVSVSSVSTTSSTTTTTTTTASKPYILHGIDISAWQGNIDFTKTAKDPKVGYAILRAGYGKYLKQEDPYFQTYYNSCKAQGIPVGAYWYSYAMTPEEARLEANICAQVIAGKTFEYPIAYDIEEPKQLAMSTEEISALIDAFCSEMEKHGYYAMLYCSSYYLNHKINDYCKDRYDVWCAHYNVSKPTYTGAYGMWQYGYIQNVGGINGDVDADYCYRDYPSIIKRIHLNGY